MKKIISTTVTLLLAITAHSAFAQQFSQQFANEAGNAIEFTLSRSEISIEGHSSNEVIIENKDFEAPPERAKGLKPLYGGGQDNTGIGLSVEEENGVLKIIQASSGGGEFVVKVPNNVRLMIEEANWGGGEIDVKNHDGEIEIKSKTGDIKLQNITGPVIANSTSGDLNIVFSEVSSANPTSVSLVSGYIDVTLPANTQADLALSSISGEIYTDLDLEMENAKDNMRRLGGGRNIDGSLNGGGIKMSLKTISGDIYLRKK